MKKFGLMMAVCASALATPAMATTIDFETNDTAGATTYNAAIGATDYDAYGVTFTNAYFKQCTGGCPAPEFGTFVSSANFNSLFSVNFATAINSFSFSNVSFSQGLVYAFDASDTFLTGFAFSAYPADFTLTASGIRRIAFQGDEVSFGVDNFVFNNGGNVNAPSGVPEPASWALMITGFALVGSAMRRRQHVRVAYA
jgi:hypothetical protein